METIRTDIVTRLCSGHPDAKPFLDPETPVEVHMSLKQSQAGVIPRRQQRDMALVAHALSTGLEDSDKALVHFLQTSEDLEEGLAKRCHKEMSQAATHPLGHGLRLLGARLI